MVTDYWNPDQVYIHLRVKDNRSEEDALFPRGGMTISYIRDYNGKVIFAYTICHIDDLYVKSVGRKIAKTRLDEYLLDLPISDTSRDWVQFIPQDDIKEAFLEMLFARGFLDIKNMLFIHPAILQKFIHEMNFGIVPHIFIKGYINHFMRRLLASS